MSSEPSVVDLRSWPYPYQALLAVCSDLDETPDRGRYWETLRFLNTTDMTALGPGVGLEVGNTIYFDMPAEQFSYWGTDDAGREMIRTLILSGHVDCLHSFGDLADSRARAARALDELAAHDCWLEVWVDHAVAPTNFGADIMRGCGDVPGHAAYHADLTAGFGIRFVWRGRVTAVVAQNTPPRPLTVWTPRHALASLRTTAKEAVKHAAARLGSKKYAMHGPNGVLRRTTLRDGQGMYEFMRCNPHYRGVSEGDTADGIGQVLTRGMLDRLVERRGACILYTHLGKARDCTRPLNAAAVAGFRRLAHEHDRGTIGVLTTQRLLRYVAARDAATWSFRREGRRIEIDIQIASPQQLSTTASVRDLLGGLTFYVPAGSACFVRVNRTTVEDLTHNPPDHTGRPSVTIPLVALAFPDCRDWHLENTTRTCVGVKTSRTL